MFQEFLDRFVVAHRPRQHGLPAALGQARVGAGERLSAEEAAQLVAVAAEERGEPLVRRHDAPLDWGQHTGGVMLLLVGTLALAYGVALRRGVFQWRSRKG